MTLRRKGLWIEDLDTSAAKDRVFRHAHDLKCSLVCIRTTSPLLEELIPVFHARQIEVYGWLWPHVFPSTTRPEDDPKYAPNEIKHLTEKLVPAGLDGYIFDIESDEGHPPKPHDWDNRGVPNLSQLATDLANSIKRAFVARGTPFHLGLTSHARGFSNYPHIPWQPFLSVSQTIYPQTYWRYKNGTKHGKKVCVDENPDPADPTRKKGIGTPEQALVNGLVDYAPKHKPIVPVAGEIGCAKAGEMTRFGQLLEARAISEAHFYVDLDDTEIDDGVLSEIAAL